MRVIGGALGRRRLTAPRGALTRPTLDRVKEALFSILGNRVLDAKVLDLFAGSGALGIEALSRGALFCHFVEKNTAALAAIKTNLKNLDLMDQTKVLVFCAIKQTQRLDKIKPFDLIFADPPYEKGLVEKVIENVVRNGLLEKDGLLVIEHSPKEILPPDSGLNCLDQRTYGQTLLSFLSFD